MCIFIYFKFDLSRFRARERTRGNVCEREGRESAREKKSNKCVNGKLIAGLVALSDVEKT